jgi:hypothetical protein
VTIALSSEAIHDHNVYVRQTQPLYELLGGVFAIAAVIERLIDRVMDNAVLNANPAVDLAHHAKPRAGFRYLVSEMLCEAAGGPQRYTGRAMPGSHDHLGISGREVSDIQQRFVLPDVLVVAGN